MNKIDVKSKNQLIQILPLFMVIFFDTISGTLIGPILPALFVQGPDNILLSGLTSFTSSFTIPDIRSLAIGFIFLQLGWSIYVQFISLYLDIRYQFNPHEIGIYMGLTGIGFALAFCYLLTFLTRHYSLRHIALATISLIVISILAIASAKTVNVAWIVCIPAATCLAISYSVLISLFSEAVSKDKQGWIMGVTGAMSAFAFGISGLIAGVLVDIDVSVPLWLALILLSLGVIAVYFTKERSNQ